MDSSAQSLDSLQAFRSSLYRCFERRAHALFELTDALLSAGPVPSPPQLSLAAIHRGRWGMRSLLPYQLAIVMVFQTVVGSLATAQRLGKEHLPSPFGYLLVGFAPLSGITLARSKSQEKAMPKPSKPMGPPPTASRKPILKYAALNEGLVGGTEWV
jgi:hypothetical protein